MFSGSLGSSNTGHHTNFESESSDLFVIVNVESAPNHDCERSKISPAGDVVAEFKPQNPLGHSSLLVAGQSCPLIGLDKDLASKLHPLWSIRCWACTSSKRIISLALAAASAIDMLFTPAYGLLISFFSSTAKRPVPTLSDPFDKQPSPLCPVRVRFSIYDCAVIILNLLICICLLLALEISSPAARMVFVVNIGAEETLKPWGRREIWKSWWDAPWDTKLPFLKAALLALNPSGEWIPSLDAICSAAHSARDCSPCCGRRITRYWMNGIAMTKVLRNMMMPCDGWHRRQRSRKESEQE